MSRAAVKPIDLLAEAARLGVSIRPGSAPGRVKLTGPSEAVQRLTPLVAQCKTALLEVLTERRLIASGYVRANGQELARMATRLQRGEALGLSEREADALADRLHARDREGPQDMHACAECGWLRADATNWRCGALRGPIPREWVATQLQRCPMFRG
jgi:hypothetical protein